MILAQAMGGAKVRKRYKASGEKISGISDLLKNTGKGDSHLFTGWGEIHREEVLKSLIAKVRTGQ
jgi:hypothetical protein